jgi:hypothetical protein
MKANVVMTKPEAAPAPSATDVLVQIAEIVMRYRNERPTLAAVARSANRASGLLRLDREARLEAENSATIALARKLGLMS